MHVAVDKLASSEQLHLPARNEGRNGASFLAHAASLSTANYTCDYGGNARRALRRPSLVALTRNSAGSDLSLSLSSFQPAAASRLLTADKRGLHRFVFNS